MSRFRFGTAVLLTMAAVAAQPVTAQTFSGPVPANAFIVYGGLDWAWASPCYGGTDLGACSSINLAGGGGEWGFATPSQWALRPDPSAFLNPSGNFAGTGGQMDCASGWFDVFYTHCDYADAVDGFLSSGPGEFGSEGYNGADETWLVRADAGGPSGGVVPEPASMTLMATGLVGIIGAGLRRKRV